MGLGVAGERVGFPQCCHHCPSSFCGSNLDGARNTRVSDELLLEGQRGWRDHGCGPDEEAGDPHDE